MVQLCQLAAMTHCGVMAYRDYRDCSRVEFSRDVLGLMTSHSLWHTFTHALG